MIRADGVLGLRLVLCMCGLCVNVFSALGLGVGEWYTPPYHSKATSLSRCLFFFFAWLRKCQCLRICLTIRNHHAVGCTSPSTR